MATKKFVGISGIQRVLGFLKDIVDSFSETIEALGRRVYDVPVWADVVESSIPQAHMAVSGELAPPGQVKPGDLLRIAITTAVGGLSQGHHEATVTEAAPPDREEGFMFAAVEGGRLFRFWRSSSGKWGMSEQNIPLTTGELPEDWPRLLPEELKEQTDMATLLSLPLGSRFLFADPARGGEEIPLVLKGWQLFDAHFQEGWPSRGRQWYPVPAAICFDEASAVYLLFDDCGELRLHSLISPFGFDDNCADGLLV